MAIRSNRDFWSDLDPHARQQLVDQRKGRDTTRRQIVRANQQAAEQGRINYSLPEDAWVQMDEKLTEVVRDELRLVSDLTSTVGTHDVPLNAKLDTWDILETHGSAEVGMDPDVATNESTVTFGTDGTPVPVVYDAYSIGFRDGAVDGKMDESIEMLHASNSTRLVSETVEDMFIDASGFNINVHDSSQGYDLYGMTDHPSTATSTTTADWTSDNTVIRDDFRDARSVLKNDRDYNPDFAVYLGDEYFDVLDDADPEGDGNMTIRDRVENLSGIAWVRELDSLASKSMLMFKPSSDVIEVGMAADIQPVQQESMFRDDFVTMGAMYPRIYQQYNAETGSTQNGILYWTA